MSRKKDWCQKLVEWQNQGWTVEHRKGGHLKMTHPLSPQVVFCGSTPSDWRAVMNVETRLHRLLREPAAV